MSALSPILARELNYPDIDLICSEGEAFALIREHGRCSHVRVGSSKFRRWVNNRLMETSCNVPRRSFAQDLIEAVASDAIKGDDDAPIFVRVGQRDDHTYLDLADNSDRAVAISAADSWQVCDSPPLHFDRPAGMLPLPVPVHGSSINELRPFVNVEHDADFKMLVAFLIKSLYPVGPFWVLLVTGQAGSGKTTLLRLVRRLLDPRESSLYGQFKSLRDLMISARNNWLFSLDNLSKVSPWVSDALCCLVCGAAYSTRTLFSDGGETVHRAKRPVMVNGIGNFIDRGDLLDRCLCLDLPLIEGTKRKPEDEFWRQFDEARPRILGALLDALVAGIRGLPNVRLASLPRMADAARLVCAAESSLGWADGDFLKAYRRNVQATDEAALEGSPIGPALLDLRQTRLSWKGTASELLRELTSSTTKMQLPIPRNWPRTPRGMRNEMDRVLPNLRRLGIRVAFQREAHGVRTIRIDFAASRSKGTGDGGDVRVAVEAGGKNC